MAMSFGLTTASAIFFFRGKFGNVITKLCHVVRPFVRNWTLLTKHDNEANATRQSGGKMIYSKFSSTKILTVEETSLVNLSYMLPLQIRCVFNTMLVLIRQERWHSQDAIPCSQSTEASYSATIVQAVYKLSFPISSNTGFVFCRPKCQQNCVSRTSVKHQASQLT